MRRFFPFRSFTSNGGNGKAEAGHDKRNDNKVDEGGTSCASDSPDRQSVRSRSRHGKPRSEESSNPQLRRCQSFSSSAIDRTLNERTISFSGDIPCSFSNTSDAPRHIGYAENLRSPRYRIQCDGGIGSGGKLQLRTGPTTSFACDALATAASIHRQHALLLRFTVLSLVTRNTHQYWRIHDKGSKNTCGTGK
ncbi:uncharacterized protein LOC121055031 [Oryza brachyantha]|uniref:uncharacterized protein LOC121055031 n=1 Tax=Oryza brachyantha TaxID=4533 RepID=UPI001ADA1CF3|nr:uncharacterized protein LOC121055031 [Oryza brachyantha]XP_040382334.1 uncharacterized protein LOC121055031 [Oryza brachyantha]